MNTQRLDWLKYGNPGCSKFSVGEIPRVSSLMVSSTKDMEVHIKGKEHLRT